MSSATLDPWVRLEQALAVSTTSAAELTGSLEALASELSTTPPPLSEAQVRALWTFVAQSTALVAERLEGAAGGEASAQITALRLQRATATLARHVAQALAQ
jgi:phage terminase Nu1 subunit (DNA packaging protein)